MIKSSIEIDGLISKLTAIERKGLPGAMMHAINGVAFEARSEWVKDMSSVFDRPTPLTARSPRVKKATPERLEAELFITPEVAEYLAHQVAGGARPMKPSERALGHFYVPAPGAPLDRYGNINFNTLRSILAQTGGRGPATSARRQGGARRNRGKRYVIFHAAQGKLRAGVYERVGRGIRAVLLFVAAPPTYSKRFDPHGTAQALLHKRFAPLFYDQLTRLVRLS